jgi:acyl carrier protein
VDANFVQVLQPFLKYAEDEEITGASRLRDLGLDSMRAIQLLFAVEDTYGMSLPDELLTDSTFDTAGSLWAAIESVRVHS